MLTFPPSVKVFMATRPADLRRSFDGLAELTRQIIAQDPANGHLFVFRNKHGDPIKILLWDRSGFVLWYKRLEKGVFQFPSAASASVQIDMATLTLILAGIDLSSVRRRPRYEQRALT
jgi:transposase